MHPTSEKDKAGLAEPDGPKAFPEPVALEDLRQLLRLLGRIHRLAASIIHAGRLGRLPAGESVQFGGHKDSLGALTRHIAGLTYQNHKLAHELADVYRLQDEVGRQRSRMENLIQERTGELIRANKRLQMEVLERDLAEKKIERKSNLLDAINHILQLTLTDLSDQALANVFLQAARKLTSSPFGIIAEQRDGRWYIAAIHHTSERSAAQSSPPNPDEHEITALWRRIRQAGTPLILLPESNDRTWEPLPRSYPGLRSLLAVPLTKNNRIPGFVTVADNPKGYALIDQFDVEVLTQAFIETLTRKRVETAKTISEKRLHLALESANEGLWDYAPISGHIYYSPRWFGLLGFTNGEFPDSLETWKTLTHPGDLTILEDIFASLIAGEADVFNVEVRMLSRTGQWLWLQVKGKTVEHSPTGEALRIVGTLSDISKYKEVQVALQKANDELQRLAALDDLTQIANRRRFDDRLGQEWGRAQRDRRYLGLIICDIDNFKNYNDTYGHLQGDQALHAVAQAVNSALKRPMDLVARIGGEEFAILMPGTDITGARRVAQEVQKAVEALRIPHKTSNAGEHVTLSFGVAAVVPSTDLPAKILLENADRTLYRAKAQGRNCIVCASYYR
jgi:diguanylate cyclase (GGDEF)-like protein/PAS domain S-box-containing protein